MYGSSNFSIVLIETIIRPKYAEDNSSKLVGVFVKNDTLKWIGQQWTLIFYKYFRYW
jgi:hypothetical protein